MSVSRASPTQSAPPPLGGGLLHSLVLFRSVTPPQHVSEHPNSTQVLQDEYIPSTAVSSEISIFPGEA